MFCHLRNYFLATCSIIKAYENVAPQLDWHSTLAVIALIAPTLSTTTVTAAKQIIHRTARTQPVKGSWMWIFRLIWEQKFTVRWTTPRSRFNRQILIGHHFNLCRVRQSIYSNFVLHRFTTFHPNECHLRHRLMILTILCTWASTLLFHRRLYLCHIQSYCR